MIFAKVKDQKEQERLDKAIDKAKDKKWYRRLMIVKLSSQGKLTRHLKKEFDVGEATIRRYINSYNDVSIASVYNSLRKTNRSTGRSTGRSKLRVGSPDPEYQVKRQNLETFEGLAEKGN